MKKNLIILSLLVSFSLGSFNVDLNSILDWSDGKIVDKELNDPEAPFPIRNFIINIEENESLVIQATIGSKSIFLNREIEGLDLILNQSFEGYQKKNIETEGGEILTYFISRPMFMRGVRLIQVSV